MRGEVKILILSLGVFAVAFALRRVFFFDVMPLAWDSEPAGGGSLQAAFLLLTIENIAGITAVIALAFSAFSLVKRRVSLRGRPRATDTSKKVNGLKPS